MTDQKNGMREKIAEIIAKAKDAAVAYFVSSKRSDFIHTDTLTDQILSITHDEWEMDEEICDKCHGLGRIHYNPNLNPNSFHGSASAICPKCNGGYNKITRPATIDEILNNPNVRRKG